MSKKQTYRIRNWSDYNASLVQKGSVRVVQYEMSLKGAL